METFSCAPESPPALNFVHRHSKLSSCLFLSITSVKSVLPRGHAHLSLPFASLGPFNFLHLYFTVGSSEALKPGWETGEGGGSPGRAPLSVRGIVASPCASVATAEFPRGRLGLRVRPVSGRVPAGPGNADPVLPGAAAPRRTQLDMLEEEQPRESPQHRRQPVR